MFQNINRNTLVKVFKTSGLLLKCSPVIVVSMNAAPMGTTMAQSPLDMMQDLKWGTKPQKIGEGPGSWSSYFRRVREGVGEEKGSREPCSSSPFQNGRWRRDAVVLY